MGGAGASTPRPFRLVCLSVCPVPAVEEAPPPGSQQPAASLLLSPARCSALPRPCVLARRRSFLRDNKSAESLFSTEGWIHALAANGRRNSLISKHWIGVYLFAVSDCLKIRSYVFKPGGCWCERASIRRRIFLLRKSLRYRGNGC